MQTGFRNIGVEAGFAQRSALYLAALGYRPNEIRTALVEELAVNDTFADEVVANLAA